MFLLYQVLVLLMVQVALQPYSWSEFNKSPLVAPPGYYEYCTIIQLNTASSEEGVRNATTTLTWHTTVLWAWPSISEGVAWSASIPVIAVKIASLIVERVLHGEEMRIDHDRLLGWSLTVDHGPSGRVVH